MQLAATQSNLGHHLANAMALARAGQFDAAESALDGILTAAPNQPDALQLLGMIARQRGDHRAATTLFRRSLAIAPRQPHVWNNLGNSLADLDQHDEAAAAYDQALSLQSDYADARINLALTHIALARPADARDAMLLLTKNLPSNARAWAVLGKAHAAMDRSGDAARAYRAALQLRPDHLGWLHNLAVALRRTGRASDALPLLVDCATRSPADANIHYNLGHCLQDLGRIEEAADAYRSAIAIAPTNVEIHESLGRMLWANGQSGSHLDSYRAALASHPDDPGLLAGFASRLTLAGQPAAAAELLAPAAARGIGGADLQFRLGQAHWSSGRPDDAFAAFDTVLARDPSHAAAMRESARSRIILNQPGAALPQLQKRLATDPFDQQALALQAIAWRLTADARADWLNDPALIGRYLLDPPDRSIEAFNQSLDATLGTLHRGQQHPLEQSLRGGTQTSDDLFDRDLPDIMAVRAMIGDGVRRYIAALPDDEDHPFLKRKSRDFAVSGSWSVRLHSGGHHENHIHPEGWISAVYYVALPGAVAHGEQGWLQFGESGLRLGAREQRFGTICPEPGLLVLFPSYFYHGTIPFTDDYHRTTIAFDIVPAD